VNQSNPLSHADEATATLTVDQSVILPWREVADVLGIPVDRFLDRLLGRLNQSPVSRLLALSDQIRDAVFYSQTDAALAAAKYNNVDPDIGKVAVAVVRRQGIRFRIDLEISEEELPEEE
jgi:hypothetical protein